MNKKLSIVFLCVFSLAVVHAAFAGNGGYLLKSDMVKESFSDDKSDCDCEECSKHKDHKRHGKVCPLPCCAKDNQEDEAVEAEDVVPLVNEADLNTKAVAEMTATTPGAPLKGTVTFQQTSTGVSVVAELSGVDVAGNHGFHIHEVGDCADEGKAAGGHFNPQSADHGYLPQDGHDHSHMGDMGNINIDMEGKGSLSVTMPGLTIKGPEGIDGRAVIVHEKEDDFGQPTGNAGGRVGCGIIKISQ